MGTPKFSVPTLEKIFQSKHEILTVYSQPAKKANRGQKITPSPIELFSKKNSLNLRTPKHFDDVEEYNFLKLAPDIVVVVAYGKIIPKKFLTLSKYGFINAHASLLPKWRGAAPIQRSIMNLDNETGVTVMKIVEELDAGPIINQEKIKINEKIDTLTLSEILSKISAKAILETIEKFENGDVKFIEQDHDKATYAKKISKDEGKIDWNDNAKKILAKINGLNPSPGAWFEYKQNRYKIWEAEIVNERGDPGKAINEKLVISCQDKSLKIIEIQKAGKSRQSVDQFLLGNKINKGEQIL